MKRKALGRRKADATVGSSLFQSRPIRLLLVDDDPSDLRLMGVAVGQIARPVRNCSHDPTHGKHAPLTLRHSHTMGPPWRDHGGRMAETAEIRP